MAAATADAGQQTARARQPGGAPGAAGRSRRTPGPGPEGAPRARGGAAKQHRALRPSRLACLGLLPCMVKIHSTALLWGQVRLE